MNRKPSKHVKAGSGSLIGRIEIGPEQMTGNTTQPLQRQDALRRDDAGLAPLGDGALIQPEFAGDSTLSASGLYSLLHRIFPHDYPLITEIDKGFNTESDRGAWQATPMIRGQSETTFWDRLLEAATANGVEPSQSAIARDLKVRQSAVAKWKAGGRPKTTRIEEIAKRYKYNVNWLMNDELPKRPQGIGEPDDTSELLSLWKNLPSAARKTLLEQIRLIRTLQVAAKREKTEIA